MIYSKLIFLFLLAFSLSCNGSSGDKKMELVFDDIVYKISDKKEGEYEILFKKHAARYHLNKSDKNYEMVLKKLNSSLEKKESVNITVDPNKLTILDVNTKK